MKKILYWSVLVAIVLVMGYIAYQSNFGNPKMVYQNATSTVEVQVDALEKQIANAIQASSTEIEVRAKNAYTFAKEQAELEIEIAIREADATQKDAILVDLQKQSVEY